MKIYAYSKAMYSTWLYLEPLRLLLDAGEGVNTQLEGRLLGFQDLAITHGHTDHFTGLQNVLVTRLRELAATEQQIPRLMVYYPAWSKTLEMYLNYLSSSINRWEELVELQPLEEGETRALQGVRGTYITALRANHFAGGERCLAYRISKERWVLRPEARGLPQEEINRRISAEGKEAITERLQVPLVLYSGDGRPLLDPDSEEVPLLIHECTFLDPEPNISHSSLGEVVALFRRLQAKNLLLFHFSSRFEREKIRRSLEELVPNERERQRIYLVYPGDLFVNDIPVSGF